MEYTQVRGLSLKASRLCLGTWAIGGWMWGGTDERVSIATIRAALERGVNVIDTAPVYGFGLAEEIVGKAIAAHGRRDKTIIATKVGIDWRDRQPFRNSSRDRIFKEVDDSLKRLGTDYIDIYQVHWPDPTVSIGETAEAMYDLYSKGKIKAIGVSNYSAAQMDEFRQIAPLHTCQPPYNLFERDIERDIVPYCEQHTITLLTYSALCRGLLSGDLGKDTVFTGDDLRNVDPKFKEPRYSQYLKAVEELDNFARASYRKRVLHLAIRWILDQGIDIALAGARRPEEVEMLDNVFGWSLDDDAKQTIDDILIRTIREPVGPEFMAPPTVEREAQAATGAR